MTEATALTTLQETDLALLRQRLHALRHAAAQAA